MPGCTNCGVENPALARYCMGCGNALAASSATGGTDRRTVSVLFCDLVGFTAWTEAADPEDVRMIQSAYWAVARAELERYGGTVEKFIGDAVMAVFGVPVAHEDDAERAVTAACAILARLTTIDTAGHAIELAARVGIATGEVLASLDARPQFGEGLVAGDVVNTAARLQSVAPRGGVVVDDRTRRLAASAVMFTPRMPVELKGKSEPVGNWSVAQLRARRERRHGARFIGRDDELARLQHCLAAMLSERTARLVAVEGDPGIGKSRLVAELRTIVERSPEAIAWREGHCRPYGDATAGRALADVVKSDAGILDGDDAATARKRLVDAVASSAADADQQKWLVRLLAPLVGLTHEGPISGRAEVAAAWQTFVTGMARRRPVVLTVEDLHWSDPTTMELLAALVEPGIDVPLLVVTTARRELRDRVPSWGTGSRRSAIALKPLNAIDTAALLSELAGAVIMPAESRQDLVRRCGGNPLFATEYVALFDGTHAAPTLTTEVPDTVLSVIAARLDQLPPDLKATLRDAAVVGPLVRPGALAAGRGARDGDVAADLDRLGQHGMLRPVTGGGVTGQAEYTFVHDLVREVAYGQIPRAARLNRHLAVARWLAALTVDRPTDQADVVAHHYDEAIALNSVLRTHPETDLVASSRRFHLLAADRAAHLDPRLVITHLDRALQLTPEGVPQRASVMRRIAWAHLADGTLATAVTTLKAAADAAHDDPEERAAATVRLGWIMQDKVGNTAEAARLAHEAHALLRDRPTSPVQATTVHLLGWIDVMAGRFEAAVDRAQELLDIAERGGLGYARACGLMNGGIARVMLDDPGGVADARAALADFRALLDGGGADDGGTLDVLSGYMNLAELRWLVEGPRAGLETAAELAAFASARGYGDRLQECRADGLKMLHDAGAWDRLEREAAEASAWCRAHDGHYSAVQADIAGAEIALHRGLSSTAADRIGGLLDAAREIGDLQLLGPALTLAAQVAVVTDRPGAALDAVRELAAAAADVPARRAQHLAPMTRVCIALDEPALTERLSAGTDLKIPRHACSHRSSQAMLVEARGDLAAAVELHIAAAAGWQNFGSVPERGFALLGAARCATVLGDSRAAGLRSTARAVFVSLDAGRLVAEADAVPGSV